MAGALTKAGRYQIVAELGRGSMGVVYQGFDPVIGRTVAIKTMLVEGLAPAEFEEYKARFQREAQAAGMLAHPNIVTVYDFGEDSGVLYLAMEFLEGKSLQALVEEQGVLPVETVIPMFEQVCGALDHAHRHNIVHRDIKPANVMILESGLVKVTDFGIAKVMSVGMTQAGQILGTPNYMSPEQVKGRAVDGRSDVFSLGVILYELVTGEKPFSGQNITTVIYKIINENPIPPRELDATIHPGLNYVIGKALAKNRDERYQTCRELAEDLKNFKNLGGAMAPSATVVVRVPQVQGIPEPAPPPAPQPPAPRQPPAKAPPKAKPPRPRPLSVQVIPPREARPQGTSAAVWILLAIFLLAGAGGGYYFFFYLHRTPAVPVGQLTITSNVPGTRISIDGKSDPNWLSPRTFPGLPAGQHTVVLSKEGYESLEQIVTVTEDSSTALAASLVALPPPAHGELTVTSTPPGATITLDGQTEPEWVTPYTFGELPAGPHTVAVSKKGYAEFQQSLMVEGEQLLTFPVTLNPLESRSAAPPAPRYGQLVITSDIPGAKVTIDGKGDPGWVTPVTIPNVPTGSHMVLITKEGYEDTIRNVTVQGGITKTLSVVLGIPSGMIVLATEPPGADVLIDGRPVGASPVEHVVGVGDHTYAVNLAGVGSREGSFKIKQNGHILKLTVPLQTAPAPYGIVEVRTIPPGASVFADGQPVGAPTPTSFRLPIGQHTLTISQSGYRPVQRRIQVPANDIVVINERLLSQ